MSPPPLPAPVGNVPAPEAALDPPAAHGDDDGTVAEAAAPSSSPQPCPLCGQLLQLGQEMERHVQQELAALEAAEAADDHAEEGEEEGAWGGRGAAAAPRQQQQQQHPQQQQQPQQQTRQRRQRPAGPAPPTSSAAVLVLGGAPRLTAPTDRRRLAQLKRHLPAKRPRPPPADFVNFYDDGSGAWVSLWRIQFVA